MKLKLEKKQKKKLINEYMNFNIMLNLYFPFSLVTDLLNLSLRINMLHGSLVPQGFDVYS